VGLEDPRTILYKKHRKHPLCERRRTTPMPVTHEPWLVALSIVVAIQGAYVGLSLAVQIAAAAGVRRRLLLAGAAFSLGTAIWAMHFIGMLAVRVPFAVDYLVLPTLLSFLACVIVVGIAVFAANAGPQTPVRLIAASVLMGSGIFTMHYIGMSALHASAHLMHDRTLMAASLAVAIAASGLALWLAAGGGGRSPLIVSAAAFGIAVSGMHYTAMLGTTLFPHHGVSSDAPALSTELLATVVAVVAFCVSGVFLLILVPDRTAPAASRPDGPAWPRPEPGAAALAGIVAASSVALSAAGPAAAAEPANRIPVEREGMTHYLAIDDIVAVHANAHYTYVFDGTAKTFCPLAIGVIEAQLGDRFARVHRSHIVNLDRVIGIRRSGDGGLVELAAAERYCVPIARGRIGWLKSRIGHRPERIAS
jgi:NO-binding membrane sensor protein with MHYT domain